MIYSFLYYREPPSYSTIPPRSLLALSAPTTNRCPAQLPCPGDGKGVPVIGFSVGQCNSPTVYMPDFPQWCRRVRSFSEGSIVFAKPAKRRCISSPLTRYDRCPFGFDRSIYRRTQSSLRRTRACTLPYGRRLLVVSGNGIIRCGSSRLPPHCSAILPYQKP